jgi:formimidoylglutamate deiminase
MVNAHSHAFQILLRGVTETAIASSSGGSFWTWREKMYAIASRLSGDQVRDSCRLAFEEMIRGGITTVGEFHYLHHEDTSGVRDFGLDRCVVEAAQEAGIRMVLIQTMYRYAGVGNPPPPPAGAQLRFTSGSVEEIVASADAAAKHAVEANPETQASRSSGNMSLALAAHSIRAVSVQDVASLAVVAKERGVATSHARRGARKGD